MKLSQKIHMDTPIHLTPSPGSSGRLHEVTWRIGGVLTQFLTLDLDETFTEGSDG